MAHDIRNPLAVIEFTANRLIHDRGSDRHVIDQGLRRILRSVHRAERLVQDLFDAATRGQIFDLQFTALPPALLLAEAKAAGEPLAADASLSLEVADGPELPAVRVDPERIAQVFDNLIGNAIKFTPRGGRIAIRAVPADGEVHFTIADTGGGVSEHDRARVFAAHWQHDAADGRGRGLGLWICREIVEAHGGRIWMESHDRSTTVTFTLPTVDIER